MANLIGTGLNQVPTNGLLGNMAFQNKEAVSMDLLTTTGNVGIGTGSPGARLHVSGGNFYISGSGTYSEPTVIAGVLSFDSANGDLNISARSSGGDTFTRFWTSSAGAGSEKMRLTATGNLGLGQTTRTTTATYKAFEFGQSGYLAAVASGPGITLGSNYYIAAGAVSTYSTNGAATYYGQINGAHQWFNAPSGTAGNAITFTQAMTLDASGNLGIGTASPGAKLDVVTGAARWRVTNDGSGNVVQENLNSAGSAYSNLTQYSNNFIFATSGTERMRITSTGAVGVGTSSPSDFGANFKAITVVGSIGGIFEARGASSSVVRLQADTAYGMVDMTSNHPLLFRTNSIERVRITNTGDVGIGTATPAAKLEVKGNGIFSTLTAGTPSSFSGTSVLIGGGEADGGAIKFYPNNTFSGDVGQIRSFPTDYGATSAGALAFHTNGGAEASPSERVRITSAGNVGVGTTSPLSGLHFNKASSGTVTALANALNRGFIISDSASTNAGIQIGINGGSASYLQARNNTGAGASAVDFAINPLGGNIQIGTASLATTATSGFPYIPTCAGTPTGTPTAITGFAPMVVDSTNNKLYVYVGGAWQAMN